MYVVIFGLSVLLSVSATELFKVAGNPADSNATLPVSPAAADGDAALRRSLQGSRRRGVENDLAQPYDHFEMSLVHIITLFISADNFPDTMLMSFAGWCGDGQQRQTECEFQQVALIGH